MPLISTHYKVYGGHLLVWRLEESVEELKKSLPDWMNFTEYLQLSHPLKQREWLAGRHLFIALCNSSGITYEGIWKSPEGKPFLLNSSAHISLTHSERFVAAVIHPHLPVGIDLEKPREQLIRIAPKFLASEELDRTDGDIDLLCQYWSAKEAAYKLVGEKKISFREHILIRPAGLPLHWRAIIDAPVFQGEASVHLHRLSEYYLAVALPPSEY